MKKNPSLLGLLIILGVLGIIVIIYNLFLSKKDGYIIDNPTEQIIKMSINQQEYTIAPQQQVRLDLERGKHKIAYEFGNKKVDTVIEIRRPSGVINPTLSDYYVFTRPYGVRKNKDSIFTSHHIAIDNKAYLGMITKEDDLYIEDFYYNLDQDYPKIFLKSDEKKTDLSKIFNKEDFKQFYFENYE
ncbi:MAG TPA: hypothetical protein VIG94_11460 [Faecalibacter sp.]